MKIKKVKGALVLEAETGNDCFTCGVIAARRDTASVEMADYGFKSIRIPDETVLITLCDGRYFLPKGMVRKDKK